MMRKDLKLVGILAAGLAFGAVGQASAADQDPVWGAYSGSSYLSSSAGYGRFYNGQRLSAQRSRNNYNFFQSRASRRLSTSQRSLLSLILGGGQFFIQPANGGPLQPIFVSSNGNISLGNNVASGGSNASSTSSSSGGGSVPAPGTLLVLLTGLLGLLAFRRKV